MGHHRLSVVVPAFNESESIGLCLSALSTQMDAIHEVIVVDNNSTDTTAEVVREFAASHPKVVLVEEPRQGLIAARNRGLDSASGDILARIDADTRVGPGWARAVIEFFERHGDSVAGTGLCSLYDAPFQERFRTAHRALTTEMMAKPSELRSYNRLFGSNMAMMAQAWRQIRDTASERDDLFEDLDLTLCLQAIGVSIGVIPGADATISGRRYLTGPVSHIRYCLCDQRTYAVHGQTRQRVSAMIGMVVSALPFYAAMYFPFRAYDPATETFSAKMLLRGRRPGARAHV